MVILGSVFVFIIAVVFRLLDNSAGLLIANGISVSPFYLSADTIKMEMDKLDDSNKSNESLKRKLRRNLMYQKFHIGFTILAIITLIIGIVYEIYNPQLINLF